MVLLKRVVAEAVENWNAKLIASSSKKDSEKKKDKPQQTQVVEDTDVSETERSASPNALSEIASNSDLHKSENSFSGTPPTNIIPKKNKSLDHGDCK